MPTDAQAKAASEVEKIEAAEKEKTRLTKAACEDFETIGKLERLDPANSQSPGREASSNCSPPALWPKRRSCRGR